LFIAMFALLATTASGHSDDWGALRQSSRLLVDQASTTDLRQLSLPALDAHWAITEFGRCPPFSRACASFLDWQQEESLLRQKFIKGRTAQVWKNYEQRAWGFDELQPKSGKGIDNWGSLGVTLVDTMDTLWLMGLQDEFDRAVEWVRTELNYDVDTNLNAFEASIRSLGGLLAAYSLSGETVLLDKAEDLGNRLLRAHSPGARLPCSDVNLQTGKAEAQAGFVALSEVYTPVEYKVLSEYTRDCGAAEAVEGVLNNVNKTMDLTRFGLAPILLDFFTALPYPTRGNKVALGARGDSFYEYLLKEWLWQDRTDDFVRQVYDAFLSTLEESLVTRSRGPLGNWTAILEVTYPHPSVIPKMDHLVCFLPGVLALDFLSSEAYPDSYERVGVSKMRDSLQLAEELAATCMEMYDRMETGLAPEITRLNSEGFEDDSGSMHNLLRPETVESLFILWRTTHDWKYREQGWRIMMAFEKFSRVQFGYSGIRDVSSVPVVHDDAMPSFFTAETMKYLYLLFSDDSLLPLTDWVFTTEAHPVRVVRGGSRCGRAGRPDNSSDATESPPTMQPVCECSVDTKGPMARKPRQCASWHECWKGGEVLQSMFQ